MEKVIIVDENDKRIGLKPIEKIERDDIYRVSALWIENSRDEILIAQRSFKKGNAPGKWGPAVAGTVEDGEDYDQNIYKETEEEIGLAGEIFEKCHKVRRTGEIKFFCQWYYLEIDREIEDFKIQEEEVEKLEWVKRDELVQKIERNPGDFLSSMRGLVDFFENRK